MARWFVFVLMGSMSFGFVPAVASAEGCPNEQIRQVQQYAAGLPDCRAYEQVSPVDKNSTDAYVQPGITEAVASGGAVTYSSLVPFGNVAGGANFMTYISRRGPDGWSTSGLLPKTEPDQYVRVEGISPSLENSFVVTQDGSLATGGIADEDNFYVGDDVTGDYQLLSPLVSLFGLAYYVGESADGTRILFESEEQLLSNAAPGVPNLYEWNNGQLQVEGVLPDDSVPTDGTDAGTALPYGPNGNNEPYTQGAVSADGSRVVFTDRGTGRLYMRENETNTIWISASQRSVPDPNGTQPANWLASTPDDSQVFFTSEEKLTNDATASPGAGDLYRFEVAGDKLTDLTTASTGGADVGGILGISEDGSYLYFEASGALAAGATAGANNVYLWHSGVTTFITGGLDGSNWIAYRSASGRPGAPAWNGKSSRVTPDGRTLLISSNSKLTNYENAGHYEIYLYNASSGHLACASCNPTGAPATQDIYLVQQSTETTSSSTTVQSFLTHNLSDDGTRVFFDTAEALVPSDTNDTTDVYEWDNGHIYLISGGRGASPSFFGDASADGDDVFFSTRESLVGQDQDFNSDIYDARVDGGIAAQNPPVPSAPCSGEECRGALAGPPALAIPSSTSFSGAGNLAPATTVATGPHKVVKEKPKKKSKRKKKPKRKKAGKARKSVYARNTVEGVR